MEPIRIFRSRRTLLRQGYGGAGQLVFDDEPEKLERLASYLTRAPIKLGSITETPEGRVSVTTPPHPLTGNTVLLLDPLDWIHAICQQIIPGGVASK